tara:strand:- start:22219 stop:22401 length:183 start_codon:yes stop_codon:yes gene_type:complete
MKNDTENIIFQIVEEEVDRFKGNDLSKKTTKANIANSVKKRIDNIEDDVTDKESNITKQG